MLWHKNVLERHYQWAAAQSIMDILKSSGFKAFLAGGCVRDGLLARSPNDLDIATDARPDQVEALFAKTIDVGKSFGVIRVLFDGCDLEVATFRKDGAYIDGRRPVDIEFTDAEQDALRRDFTMNALFYDADKNEVLDFVDGCLDIEKKLIRTVGVAEQRFDEDQLRMLRAIRFAAQLGFEIEEATMKAIQKHAWRIHSVSGERVKEELSKFFKAPEKIPSLSVFKSSGLESALFPQIKRGPWYDIPVQQFIEGLCLYLCHDLENPRLEEYLNLLKLSSREKKFFESFRKTMLGEDKLKSLSLGKQLQLYADPGARWACQVLVFQAEPHIREEISALHQEWLRCGETLPKPFLTGQVLLDRGLKDGKQVGALLQEAYDLQLSQVLLSEAQALVWADEQIKSR